MPKQENTEVVNALDGATFILFTREDFRQMLYKTIGSDAVDAYDRMYPEPDINFDEYPPEDLAEAKQIAGVALNKLRELRRDIRSGKKMPLEELDESLKKIHVILSAIALE